MSTQPAPTSTTSTSTSPPQNHAAYLDTPNTPLRVGPAPLPVPLPHEILIEVHAVAINPVDAGRQALGFLNPSHPWIFGSDLAGVVVGMGRDVEGFEIGR